MEDLTQYWFYKNEDVSIKCYVFDNHRPIHHNNIHDKKKVLTFVCFKYLNIDKFN